MHKKESSSGLSGFRHAAVLLSLGSLLASSPAAAGPVLDRVKAAATVRVCVWPDYYGITYRNPRNQQMAGVDIDLSAEFAKDHQFKLVYVNSSFQTLIDDVTQDRCDVAMFAVGITPQRQKSLRFSQPYMQSDVYGVTTAGQPRGQKLGRHRQARCSGGGAGRHLHGAGDGCGTQAGQAGRDSPAAQRASRNWRPGASTSS